MTTAIITAMAAIINGMITINNITIIITTTTITTHMMGIINGMITTTTAMTTTTIIIAHMTAIVNGMTTTTTAMTRITIPKSAARTSKHRVTETLSIQMFRSRR